LKRLFRQTTQGKARGKARRGKRADARASRRPQLKKEVRRLKKRAMRGAPVKVKKCSGISAKERRFENMKIFWRHARCVPPKY